MGVLQYKSKDVAYAGDDSIPSTYKKVAMTDQQYATIAALCSAKSLVAGDVFVVTAGADTQDYALTAARSAVLKQRSLKLSMPYDAFVVDAGAASVTYKQEAFYTSDILPQCRIIDAEAAIAAAMQDTGAISVYNFDQLKTVVDSAVANAVIKLADAVFDFTDTLLIKQPLTILADRSATFMNSSLALSGPLVSIELAAQMAEANVIFKNLSMYHQTADKNNIEVNNTSVGQNLKIYLMDCGSDITVAGTGCGLSVSHAAAGKPIIVRVSGKGYHKVTNIAFTTKNAGDLLECSQLNLAIKSTVTDAITLSADAVASNFVLRSCTVPTGHAIAGGNSAQKYLSAYSLSDDGAGTIDEVKSTDITALGTATVKP